MAAGTAVVTAAATAVVTAAVAPRWAYPSRSRWTRGMGVVMGAVTAPPGMCGPQQPYQNQPYAYNNGYPYQPQAGYPGQQYPQWSADEVNQRLQHQADRIQAGIASGQITPEEAQRLQAEQSRIQAAMTRMQANGNLSPGELARLNRC